MSNSIDVVGAITFFNLRPNSFFMNVREDGQHGSNIIIKGFCPGHLKETPEIWAAHYRHFEQGMRVHVKGKLSFEKETTGGEGGRVPVKHPVTGRDLYSAYVWAASVNAVFDPAVHMKKSTAALKSPTQERPAAPSAPVELDGDLPPLPDDSTASRAPVAWR